MTQKMTIEEMRVFLVERFPEAADQFSIEAASEEGVTLRMQISNLHLRPGGTVSGPSMFGLADVAFYLATLAQIGPRALAVTTNCSIDFMRRPKPVDMLATARVLKLGRNLSVGDVMIYSEGDDEPVARASFTYSIPPEGVE